MKKRTRRIISFAIGIGIFLLMLVSYFITIEITDAYGNITLTPLLGILIFYNVFVLGFYCLVGLFFIGYGLYGIRFKK